MRVTIEDIAKAANVSPSTVSNVFTGNNRVSEATRMRVLELARNMGYKNPSRPMMRNGILFVLFIKHGRIISETPFFSELITGVESACRKYQHELTISYVHSDDTSSINSILNRKTTRPILLLATEMSEEDLRPFLKVNAPMVILDSNFLNISFPTVYIDNIKAGYTVAEYLISMGHRKLGFISSSYSFNNMCERRIGFELAIKKHGLSLSEDNVFAVDPTFDGAYSDMIEILEARRTPLPTGIFAFNDIVGISAIRALLAKNIKVPEDISIVGMDNLPASALIKPAMTSINVPKYALGYQAVEQLIKISVSEDMPILKTSVDVHLVMRDSVMVLGKQ